MGYTRVSTKQQSTGCQGNDLLTTKTSVADHERSPTAKFVARYASLKAATRLQKPLEILACPEPRSPDDQRASNCDRLQRSLIIDAHDAVIPRSTEHRHTTATKGTAQAAAPRRSCQLQIRIPVTPSVVWRPSPQARRGGPCRTVSPRGRAGGLRRSAGAAWRR